MAIYQIQIRRGTSAAWTAANPILAAGEFGLEVDTRRIKIGSGCVVAIGATVFKDLPDGATLLSDGRTILRSWT